MSSIRSGDPPSAVTVPSAVHAKVSNSELKMVLFGGSDVSHTNTAAVQRSILAGRHQNCYQQQTVTASTTEVYESSRASLNMDASHQQRSILPCAVTAQCQLHTLNEEHRNHLNANSKKAADYLPSDRTKSRTRVEITGSTASASADSWKPQLKGILKKSKSTEQLTNKRRLDNGKIFRFSMGNLYRNPLNNHSDHVQRTDTASSSLDKDFVESENDLSYGFVSFELKRKGNQRRRFLENKQFDSEERSNQYVTNYYEKNLRSLPNISEVASLIEDAFPCTNSIDPIFLLTNGAVREIKINEINSFKSSVAPNCASEDTNKSSKITEKQLNSLTNHRSKLKLSGIKTTLTKSVEPDESELNAGPMIAGPAIPRTVPWGRRRAPVLQRINRNTDNLQRTIYYMSDIIDKQVKLETVNRKNCSTSDLANLELSGEQFDRGIRYQSLSDLHCRSSSAVGSDSSALVSAGDSSSAVCSACKSSRTYDSWDGTRPADSLKVAKVCDTLRLHCARGARDEAAALFHTTGEHNHR